MEKEVKMDNVQNYLSNLDFPAHKQAIIGQAKHKSAPHEVISVLNGISDREYMDIEDLTREIQSK